MLFFLFFDSAGGDRRDMFLGRVDKMRKLGQKARATDRFLYQNVAMVEVIALAADIAKFAQAVERAADGRFGYLQRQGQAAHRMRAIA